ncbi:copper amine oxidase N-terminal domain-containing protein [Paenibacillus guangzhouensis]|uniref:copper amine oxidase N-terminal domain-containing protein n=1 Tax=Paenibacillus guangzhouensis TaxID=1473112 RepID=UPI00187B6EDA|nr:copper amine oxidase N-terminal domain-containing protein [Paenibacillus guangzhouensis]
MKKKGKWMTSILSMALVGAMIIPIDSVQAFETSPNETKIFVNANYVKAWRYEKDRVLVPLIALNTPPGKGNEIVPVWDSAAKRVTVYTSDKKRIVKLQADQLEADVNGDKVKLDVPVRIIDGRTFVPLRFVSEALGGEVRWDPESHATYVRTPVRVKRDGAMRTGALAEARKEVLNLPWYYPYRDLHPQSKDGAFKVMTFPEGEALRYWVRDHDLETYVEVNEGGVAVVKWQGRFDAKQGKYVEEQGTHPDRPNALIVFNRSYAVGGDATYGRADAKGTFTAEGEFALGPASSQDADAIVAISNEVRIPGK